MAVRWGTRADQETVTGTLQTLPGLIHGRDLKPPATIIVGEVVALGEKLNWYERLPLFGQKIVVTRPREQASALSDPLRALGANVIELPAIEIRPASDYAPLDRAIRDLCSYDWLIFTSANGVRFFLDRLDRSGSDLRSIRGKICAIGPATRAAIEALHLKVDLMGEEYVAESLLEAFAPIDLDTRRILLARAAVARDLLPAELGRRGAHVDVVEAYRAVAPDALAAQAAQIFQSSHKPDWITFTSSSTVHNFIDAIPPDCLYGVKVASIGPVTSATVRERNLSVTAEASVYTAEGLVQSILEVGQAFRLVPPALD
jgi:uroporphyrinogen III methyltransferase/synthase